MTDVPSAPKSATPPVLDRPGPSLADVLAGAQDLGRLELVAQLRADQARRWQAGQRVRAEDYLQEVPALRDDPELAIVLIYSEFLLRRDVLGEAPGLDEYLARFPQHATALGHQHGLEALWQEVCRTQGNGGPAPVTAAAPPGASEWTVVEAGVGAPAAPSGAPALPGYAVLGELGRGGMGLVFKGHDLHLGRDLAIKLLRHEFHGQPHLVRRFLNEARVCGRLQHPGIVPVYQLGSLPDHRPYFTMKLVEGRTLADLLDERASPGQDLPRFLTTFEQVCQTLGYAHSKGVIHRDLKPGNIMVGAFGEVQVMDWGLAKVLSRGADSPTVPVPAAAPDGNGAPAAATDRWLGTQSGGAMGTLPYAAPEQARGEVERMDERCDVFGLGAILCEILTGRPPFAGRDGAELLARARACDHAEALARLETCGADGELVGLAKRCLAAEPSERPRDAGVVAREVKEYLTGVQERLRVAEVERVAAQARAEEARATAAAERRARRRTLGLVAAALVIVALAGAGLLWFQRQHEEKQRQQEAQARAVNDLLDQVAGALQAWKLSEAAALLRQAEQAAEGGPDDLLDHVRRMRHQLTVVNELARTRLLAMAVVDGKPDLGAAAEPGYSALFRAEGLPVEEEDEAVVAGRIRDLAIREQLVAALDDWAAVTKHESLRPRLLKVARLAQPGTWTDHFRDPEVWKDRDTLERLARDADVTALSPQLLTVLGRGLQINAPDAVPFLKRAQAQHPDDFHINLLLGMSLARSGQPQEAIAYYRAALAVRPNTSVAYNNLSVVLKATGQLDEAIAASRQALLLDPTYATAYTNLGAGLEFKGAADEAAAACRQALALDPNLASPHVTLAAGLYRRGQFDEAIRECRLAIACDGKVPPAYNNLGLALQEKGQLRDAVQAFRTAVALDPRYLPAHSNLGSVLLLQGQFDEAIEEHRKAIALDRNLASVHVNLGVALYFKRRLEEAVEEYHKALELDPLLPTAHSNLGRVRLDQDRVAEAFAECCRAIELDPNHAASHRHLGLVLVKKGQVNEAIAEFLLAIKFDKRDSRAHFYLGSALQSQRRLKEAIVEYRRCIDIDKTDAAAHYNLGVTLEATNQLEEAVAEYRLAIARDGKFAAPHLNLGLVLQERGQLDQAIAELRTAVKLDPNVAKAQGALGGMLLLRGRFAEAREATRLCLKLLPADDPTRPFVIRQLKQCEDFLSLEPKLSAVLRGDVQPADARERVVLAELCGSYKRRYAAAASLYADAFAIDPRLAEAPLPHRYNAACAAAQAGCGLGEDAQGLPDKVTQGLRRQALRWLRAELAACAKQTERATVREALRHWQEDSDLIGVRDPKGLAKLPVAERLEWRELWDDVAALLIRAGAASQPASRP